MQFRRGILQCGLKPWQKHNETISILSDKE